MPGLGVATRIKNEVHKRCSALFVFALWRTVRATFGLAGFPYFIRYCYPVRPAALRVATIAVRFPTVVK
uniref:Uncharacterized protein n=1 Tax=Candidatus Kentrum sp. FM TaxID=2126340 RepID=A0A450SVE2_9GAMM|nr:MAG: hypothetical protein BECKFM1743C_GA0114222_102133 [Candidatus Kentron sp. FM]VFJ62508.1 MAG: hypothetical protein BECKFM1743A_GA0114220_103085 [Candidatus Kentron sp. FM]